MKTQNRPITAEGAVTLIENITEDIDYVMTLDQLTSTCARIMDAVELLYQEQPTGGLKLSITNLAKAMQKVSDLSNSLGAADRWNLLNASLKTHGRDIRRRYGREVERL